MVELAPPEAAKRPTCRGVAHGCGQHDPFPRHVSSDARTGLKSTIAYFRDFPVTVDLCQTVRKGSVWAALPVLTREGQVCPGGAAACPPRRSAPPSASDCSAP